MARVVLLLILASFGCATSIDTNSCVLFIRSNRRRCRTGTSTIPTIVRILVYAVPMLCVADNYDVWFCRYVNKDREITKRFVQHAEKRGIKGLFITVDAPQLGRREKDMRMKFEADDPAEVRENDKQGDVDRSQGAARAISVRCLHYHIYHSVWAPLDMIVVFVLVVVH